jgi:rare lipoprotein A
MHAFFCCALGMVSIGLMTASASASIAHKGQHSHRASHHGKTEATSPRHRGNMAGMASYYGSESGQRSASGARINPAAMTAAHPSLPFGTKVRVTNQSNGRSVVVTINDRGPFVRGRIIDVSTGAADVMGMKGAGVARVTLEVVRD